MFYLGLFYILLIKLVNGLDRTPYSFINESIGSSIVSTTSGKFAGLTIGRTNVWIGIPYAAAPVDTLRWQKAQPYVMTSDQNSTIQNATHYGPSCPQTNQDGSATLPIDEDCLYLNVWAPQTPSPISTGYPVMIWIHGGEFTDGSASTIIYDGLSWTNAAMQDNNSFIMVSINYRLNVMGFFYHPSLLDQNGKIIANQGITDQRMAMQWVQDNIAQFGGDKNSVTIMGESAGSHSVCLHIASKLSAGLFHAGILQSGTCDTLTFLRDDSFANATINSLASLVGCNRTNSTEELACLRAVDSNILVANIANVSISPSTSLAFKNQEKIGGILPFSVIVDGIEIPVHPLKAFLSGTFNQVPILIGANKDEFLLRVLYETSIRPPTSAEDYLTRILPIITYNNSELQTLYAPDQFNDNYTQACVALLSQQIFISGARRMAGYMSEQPAYLYAYTHTLESSWFQTPTLTIWPGAYHISELFTLFQTLLPSFYGNVLFQSDELSLVTSIRRYWTNMITKHHPNDNISSLIWPQYSSTNDQVIILDKNMTITTYTEIYPNIDLLSEVLVKVFGEYLGLNATCTAGNNCFILPSVTTTTSTTTSSSHYQSYGQVNVYVLFLLYIVYSF